MAQKAEDHIDVKDDEHEVPSKHKRTKKQLKKEKRTVERALQREALNDDTVASTKTETSIALEEKGAIEEAASVTAVGSVTGEIAEEIADKTPVVDAKSKGKEPEKVNKKGIAKAKTEYGANIPKFVERVDSVRWKINQKFVPHMKTEAMFYASDALVEQIFVEYNEHKGSMLPALQQLGNVAALPGIVGFSLGMPDLHSGYGFAIGNVAAIDMSLPEAVVVPGGVGFDINCGVRLLRTNLTEQDVHPVIDKLNTLLFKQIPLGVSSEGGLLNVSKKQLDELLNRGMEYLLERGDVWPEDLEMTEEGGRIKLADSSKVSDRAKSRGVHQVGSLGSGNHYMEIQVVDEIFDKDAAATMGLKLGGVCVMIHSGSRGLGHQVCSDYLQQMQCAKDNLVHPNDRQLTGVKINSPLGQHYLAGMSAAANFAFCNRSMMMAKARQCFEETFKKSARHLDMYMVYDVAHNIAKVEKHTVNGTEKTVLVHRKGATRAFPPGHPEIPAKYRGCGQPILIGGSMGTSSYVLTGTNKAMEETFGSTCHGAGRVLSRSAALRELSATTVMNSLSKKGISVKVGTKKLVAEEAPESYKDVSQVVQTCHDAGISKLCVRLRPLAVIKG